MKWIYGWLRAGGFDDNDKAYYDETSVMLYVRLRIKRDGVKYPWGVTLDIKEATKFKSKQECLNHWKSIHAFPPKYDAGYLHFMNDKGQLILF